MADPDIDIELLFTDPMQMRMARRVYDAYPDFVPPQAETAAFPVLDLLHRTGIMRKRSRLAMLVSLLARLRTADAIVVPERTTTAIRHFLPSKTRLIFTPHGAGDRAITFDKRDRHFDFALVAGPKSEERMLKDHTIRPRHYAVNGYIKADLMQKLGVSPRPLLDNDRPTVLYVPHFRHSLSSWDRFGREVIDAFARQDRYNLVVAPHYRLFSDAPESERRAVEALSVPGKIIVDLRSDRLFDMSYTLAANIYLGDVSSQVYEFLTIPRPCIFLDAHDTNWKGDPDYRFWTLGDVVNDTADLMRALEVAPDRHPLYRDLQQQALADSIGDNPSGAAARGAAAILKFLKAEKE